MRSKVLVLTLAALAMMVAVAPAGAVNSYGPGYQLHNPADNPGDCVPNLYGDDADGDGIPNGQDPDYAPPCDGSGKAVLGPLQPDQGPFGWIQRWMRGFLGIGALTPMGPVFTSSGYGPGDGTGTGDTPQDGTGYGPGGDGDCDGTGPDGYVYRHQNNR